MSLFIFFIRFFSLHIGSIPQFLVQIHLLWDQDNKWVKMMLRNPCYHNIPHFITKDRHRLSLGKVVFAKSLGKNMSEDDQLLATKAEPDRSY